MFRLSIALITALLPAPALAQLMFCNDTSQVTSVAIGYSDDGTWTSEGWWTIRPGDCSTVVAGDLPKRYYYWRPTTENGAFDAESYMFCTSKKVFTIAGDSDCSGRGYDRHPFSELDTGDARSHTVRLTAAMAPGGGQRDTGNPGAAVSVTGILSHCAGADDALACEIHADGRRYVARAPGATPLRILQQLDRLPLASPIRISGDLIARSGIRTNVAIQDFQPGPPDAYSDLRNALQGRWVDASDGTFQMVIHGTTLEDFFGELSVAQGFFEIADSCEGAEGAGPVLRLSYLDFGPGERLCWVFITRDNADLAFRAVGASRDLLFNRAD